MRTPDAQLAVRLTAAEREATRQLRRTAWRHLAGVAIVAAAILLTAAALGRIP